MPHRRAIVTVVGRPISVQQHDKPTMEMIAEAQGRYIEELLRYVRRPLPRKDALR